jgi:5-methylcytosine-specific restriction endonuclease McrA
MRKRSKTLKLQALKRDNFTCQKCKLEDKTGIKLEAHHITPLYLGGKEELGNLITLCFDCHKFAPDKKEEFDEYMKDELEGTLTTLIKAYGLVRKEHPELIKEINKKEIENDSKSD